MWEMLLHWVETMIEPNIPEIDATGLMVNTMQIIIPMSGFGERFRRAGYDTPKPLIEIDGKPIIAHVIDMFPGETDFTFICSREHLAEPAYRMEETILRYCPTGKVIGINPHKLGPVHAVLQIADQIDLGRPAVVNYADFTCYWNWRHFRDFVKLSRCDGAIPAYKGFHPHTLGTTNYAYMRETDGWVDDIQEKQPYTDNRMEEYASSGTYYFANGRLMLDAFNGVKEQNLNVGGEFYVSLAYKPMLAQGRPIAVYELQHFMQWGTPEDVAEYNGWSNAFRRMIDTTHAGQRHFGGSVVVPMAGLGKRFSDEGYVTTKPLIPVSGQPMVVQAVRYLPAADRYVFVLRKDMQGVEEISATLKTEFPSVLVEVVEEVTEGQACSAAIGFDSLVRAAGADTGPITFGACDNGALYDEERLAALVADPDTDVIVWAVRGHANALRRPTMFGWIDAVGDKIRNISVKVPLEDPSRDPIVLGTFTFRRAADFRRCFERLKARDARVNGEFYLDTCINDALELGLNCRMFEVDSYLSWGTPNDLRTFEYWQSCFHKWEGHPYSLEQDPHVAPGSTRTLLNSYSASVPGIPHGHA